MKINILDLVSLIDMGLSSQTQFSNNLSYNALHLDETTAFKSLK
jgi:hypothetical protein